MLFAHNVGGLRLAAAIALSAAIVGCSTPAIGSNPSPLPTHPSQAADLRTRLDLLLAEHVMIVAKESAAAVDHSDEYAAYTSLLATNTEDLSALIGRAFGNTASAQFAEVWSAQNGYLVDYAIGVVTHNDDRANAAMTGLTGTFIPQFVNLVSGLSKLPRDALTQTTTEQAKADMAFIDDVFAGNFAAYYAHVHQAYAHTSRLGDALAEQIVIDFPDKFPGSSSDHATGARVALNLLLQEHSYLATMVTDAAVNNRDAEKTTALAALNSNIDSMRTVRDQQFTQVWAQESASLSTYAMHGDDQSRKALTDNFTPLLASASNAPPALIATHVSATLRVIDDQRTRSSKSVASDDRAAATSMQPIADSAVQG